MTRESRTAKLLKSLGIDPLKFIDPELPTGVFSHSQYSQMKKCGEAYKKRYIEKVSSPNYSSTSKGSAVHGGIEYMLNQKKDGKTPDLDLGVSIVEQIFDEKAAQVEKWEEGEPQGVAKDNAIAMFKHFSVYALPQLNPKGVELGFAKKLGDVPMIGYIDMTEDEPAVDVTNLAPEEIELAPMKEVVVDWKTATKKWSDLQVQLSTQITTYTHVRGTPHARVDQLVKLKKGVNYVRAETTRTKQDVENFVEDLNEVVTLIKKGVFPKAPLDSWMCNEKHCSFYSLCRGRKR